MAGSLFIQDLERIYNEQLHLTPALLDYNRLAEHPLFAKAISPAHRKALADARKPQSVNFMASSSLDDKERINRSIYTRYISENSNAVIEDIPSCFCGAFTTYKNLDCLCPKCKEPVLSTRTADLHSLVWISAPKDIPALINPTMLRMLQARFNVNKFDVIRWVMDYSYVGPGKVPPAIDQLTRMNIPRGVINFYQHFDKIFEILMENRLLKKTGAGAKQRDEDFREFMAQNRHKLFTTKLPVPNKMLLVIESNNFATYMDTKLTGIIDAVWLMVGIDSEHCTLSLRQKEIRVAKALAQIAEFHKDSDNTTLSRKEGILRRNVFGMRAWGSFRTVISSITGPHDYRDIYVPWHVAMTVYHYHLVNKLEKRIDPDTGKRYTPHKIDAFIDAHVNKWHPIFREIFDELLAESPNGRGLPCLSNRNPSLYRNSIQMNYITKIKDDVTDVTTSISILAIGPFNALYKGLCSGNITAAISLIAGTTRVCSSTT